MKTRRNGTAARHLNTLFNLGAIRELTDGQLLERFSTAGGEVGELAFAALVERHGAMVLRVCRAQLANSPETHDAFQVTFLILVKKAKGLWVRDSLGPWLHQVAYRTAACARSNARRRRRHEERLAEFASNGRAVEPQTDETDTDLETVVHEAINQLPERYRLPIILCDLQGLSCEEAARKMGRSVGTVKSWRFRAREKLRRRLNRFAENRGVDMGVVFVGNVGLKPPTQEMARLAVAALRNGMTSEAVSASLRTLWKGVLKMMLISQLRTAALGLLTLAILGTGLGAYALSDDSKGKVQETKTAAPTSPPTSVPPTQEFKQEIKPAPPTSAASVPPTQELDVDDPPRQIWNLTLRDAIRIGLGNSEIIRVVSLADNEIRCKILPQDKPVDPQRLKAEVMAGARSIEQLYWTLSQQLVLLWGEEKRVKLVEAALTRERAKQTLGIASNVKEAVLRLEQAKLNVVTRMSDVITVDRDLRKVMNVASEDSRRIVLSSPPTETRVEPDWNDSLATMLEKQPDILRAQAEINPTEKGDQNGRSAASLRKTIEEATQALARFHREIDSNYQQLQKATADLSKTADRFKEKRDLYEKGTINVDVYLDFIDLYVNAMAMQAQFKTNYNIAIIAFEEIKGTLLDHNQIILVDASSEVLPKTNSR